MTGQGWAYPRAARPGPDFSCDSLRRVEVAWAGPMPELRGEERPRQPVVGTEARRSYGERVRDHEGPVQRGVMREGSCVINKLN